LCSKRPAWVLYVRQCMILLKEKPYAADEDFAG
jgi:hypothetical protein